MRANFTFHDVGQGLFYSGKIGSFNFVYDCGSNSKGNYLKNAINNYLEKQQNKIDWLILSHLDEDHTNGLEMLFSTNKNKETTVFLPYFTPIERLIISITKTTKQASWWYQFISDPVYYLLIVKNVKNVVIIGDQNLNNKLKEDYTCNSHNLNDFPDNNPLIDLIKKNENWEKYIKKNKVLIKNHKCIVYIKEWQFKFFNHDNHDKLSDFWNSINPIVNNNIIDAIKSKGIREKIRTVCYTKIYKSSTYINQTSLMLYHAPIDYQGYIKISCTKFGEELSQIGSKNGQLLSGDISLSTYWTKILTHFKKEFLNVSFVQIPHHGSIANWSSNILKDISAPHWINSASNKRKQYPHKEIIDILHKSQFNLHCCNELNSINIEFNYPLFLRALKLERVCFIKKIRKQDCDLCYCSIKK
ncbi:MAG: hypothetical protein A2275_14715 [Bacteroidetes bacterium RIFOXYA12_FULL_35_11]|nr:MAG: hypothetical protein A2X01_17805 [Bacteroidetes bacterium GWF2_35_48]OFY76855.1 MAG: hypothetical protein A2275_14715 [Bacteroidetes bacterium RIFOXYA12_FULL_35_11]OFY92447.1 MAG: hypothetical protein A2309_13020 [Bacteroidetes bacterium RIFOXYB2_FULL_35_7]OFZ04965.1 MAG: hypothetical protein A2491_07335 [Bacteroidetes bacterium RIFOXYC12_FULL_35_7]HBX53194.1 hypothetical protein [Bacteroidales bacterium]